MPDLNLFDNPYMVVGLLVPGLIVLSVRSQFLTGRRPSHSAALLSYLTVSVIYYALALPFVDFILSFQEPGNSKVLLTWFALTFIGPALLGLLLGANIIDDENNWSSRGESGVLIAAGKVQTIEFWPYDPQEDANEQE